jgi:hypothetical protein
LTAAEWTQLKATLLACASWTPPEEDTFAEPVGDIEAAAKDASHVFEYGGDPLARWRIGHHVFLAILLSIVVGLRRFELAIRAGSHTAARESLQRCSRLLLGAASALRYTGDFSRAAYQAIVRPSMARAGPRFSGLMNEDHRAMVKKLQELKPVFHAMPEILAEDHRAFVAAKRRCMNAHLHVCEMFESNGPSLRSPSSSKPALDALRDLAARRLGYVSREVDETECAHAEGAGNGSDE